MRKIFKNIIVHAVSRNPYYCSQTCPYYSVVSDHNFEGTCKLFETDIYNCKRLHICVNIFGTQGTDIIPKKEEYERQLQQIHEEYQRLETQRFIALKESGQIEKYFGGTA